MAMDKETNCDLTALLKNAAIGDPVAAGDVYQLVHQVLRRIARQRLRQERSGHTLQATALVHEAWMKLVGDKPVSWTGRGQFYAAAADAMRRILIDHARKRAAAKRGSNRPHMPLDVVELATHDADEVLALNDAISQLEQQEPDVAAVVRLRFFAGLTIDETAAALNQSPRNVDRLWTYARARLFRMMSPQD